MTAVLLALLSAPPDDALRDDASAALRKAVAFFRTRVGVQGGYPWRCSADLEKREGEGRIADTDAWVQPPGTPAVGMAFLDAWEATGEDVHLDAARETGSALVRCQLRSGGWASGIHLAGKGRNRYAYRTEPDEGKRRNTTTLDDDKTQSALHFLVRLDRTLDFEDGAVHEAAEYALVSLLKAQYPNGGWPQRYDRFPDPDDYPVKKASYPESWPREFPRKKYQDYYTFNDNLFPDVVRTLMAAYRTYGKEECRDAVVKAGDFMLLAQMPEPQPAWAQQYDRDMHPAWARKFEPPAVTGGESQGVMRTLILIYRETGEKRFLEPIPRALEYLRASLLPDGRLARFYELRTNKPLYFTKDYVLTYSDADMPTHYGFKVGSKLDRIERDYGRALELEPDEIGKARKRGRPKTSSSLEKRVRRVIDALDARGAWVEEGRLKYHGDDDDTRRIIDSRTFVERVRTLCTYLAATRD